MAINAARRWAGSLTKLQSGSSSLAGTTIPLRSCPPAITAIMEDSRPWVRLTAAVHTLAWDPDRAVGVPKDIASKPGLTRVFAAVVLDEFRAGRLSLDW